MANFDLSLAIEAQGGAAAGAEVDGVKAKVDALGESQKGAGGEVEKLGNAAAAASKQVGGHATALEKVQRASPAAARSSSDLSGVLKVLEDRFKGGGMSARVYELAVASATKASREQVANATAVGAANQKLAASNQSVGQAVAQTATAVAESSNPVEALTENLGGAGEAMAGMGGKAGALGTFLAGPFGALVGVAIGIVGSLIASLFEAGEKTDALGVALKDETKTVTQLAEALDELHAAQERQMESAREQEVQAVRNIDKLIQEAEKARAAAAAQLELAKARYEAANAASVDPSTASETGNPNFLAAGYWQGAMREIDGRIAALTKRLDTGYGDRRSAQGVIAARRAEEAIDPRAKAQGDFERANDRLRAQLRAGAIDVNRYQKALEGEMRTREKTLDRIAEAERESRRKPRKPRREPEVDGDLTSFESPLEGRTVKGNFGQKRPGHVHAGVDMAAPAGTAVGAAAAGTVIEVGYDAGGYGNFVIIDHGRGTTTRYGHLLKRSSAAKGQKVEAGEQIGQVGSTGRSTGNHLHYEVRRGAKAVDPRKGSYPTDPHAAGTVADRIQKASDKARQQAENLAQWGDQQAARIQGLADRFLPQPKLAEQSRAALAQLDAVLAEIQERKPPNMKELLEDAKAARTAIEEGIHQPFLQFLADRQRETEIQKLVAAGRQDEADALRIIHGFQKDVGTLLPEQVAAIQAITTARRMEAREAALARAEQEKTLDSLRETRDTFRGLFDLTGKGVKEFPRRILQAVEQSIGDRLFEEIFGDTFRELEDQVRGVETVQDASQAMADAIAVANEAIGSLAQAASGAASSISGAGSISGSDNIWGGFGDSSFGEDGPDAEDIVITGKPASAKGVPKNPADFFGFIVNKLLTGLNVFGEKTSTKISKTVGVALEGWAIGGATGPMATKILGMRGSKLGGQIGGSVGAVAGQMSGIPGGKEIGAIVGSIYGSIIGGLTKKAKTGSATISDISSAGAVGGNNKKAQAAASDLAASIQNNLGKIAEALGASVGAFSVSVGSRDGNIRVDPTGKGQTKTKKGAKDFGEDANAAMGFAIADAIADGALGNISAAVKRALTKYGTDIDRGLREALKVQEVEILLGGITGAMEKVFRDFEFTANERLRIAREYGFDIVKLEKINADERAKVFNDALAARIGPLQDLLDSLNFGDLFAGTDMERRTALLGEIATTRAAADAGEDGAAQKLADRTRSLLDLTLNKIGTAGPAYAGDVAAAKADAARVIAAETERARKAQEAATASLNAQTAQVTLQNEANGIAAAQLAALNAIHAIFNGGGGGGALGGGGEKGGGGGRFTERFIDLQ